MIIAHPARYYILFLISRDVEGNIPNAFIKHDLERLDLFPRLATDEVLEAIRRKFRPPEGYDPRDLNNKVTSSYLKQLRVRDMHTGERHAIKAKQILSTPTAREIIERLLLAKAPYPRIVRAVSNNLGVVLSPEDIAAFAHYFFDVDALSRAQWGQALKYHGVSNLRSALSGIPEVELWRLGEPVEIDEREFLQEAMLQAYMRLLELRDKPTSFGTIKMMNLCIDAMNKTYQTLAETDARISEMTEKLRLFQEKTKPAKIQPASELKGLITGESNSAKLLEASLREHKEEIKECETKKKPTQ